MSKDTLKRHLIMKLSKGQKRRLRRSLRRAHNSGREYEWPVTPVNPPVKPEEPPFSLSHLKSMQTRLRKLYREFHDMRPRYRGAPPSCLQVLGIEFRLRHFWIAFRQGCRQSTLDRAMLQKCLGHWRYMPGSVGMQAAFADWDKHMASTLSSPSLTSD